MSVPMFSFLLGSFTYEKYFAGKYIGELAGLVLQKLHNENLFLAGDENSEKLVFNRDSVSSSGIDRIHRRSSTLLKAFHKFKELF